MGNPLPYTEHELYNSDLKKLYFEYQICEVKLYETKRKINNLINKRQDQCNHERIYIDNGYDYVHRICELCSKIM